MSFAYKSSEISGTNKDNLITLLVGVCIDAFDLYLLLFVMCVMETNKKKPQLALVNLLWSCLKVYEAHLVGVLSYLKYDKTLLTL
jgi:hypothetical protein